MTLRLSPLLLCALSLCLTLWSCGGNDNPPPPPTAYDQAETTGINVSLSDTLDSGNVDFSTSTFFVVTPAAHGTISLDPDNGDFTYFPDANFSGIDNFFWQVNDQFGDSNIAEYTIGVGVPAAIHVDRTPIARR